MGPTTLGDDETGQTLKQVCSWALLSTLVVALVFLVVQEKAIAKGLILGTLASVINFVLLGKLLPMTLRNSRSAAGYFGFVSIIVRYVLMAIPMIIAVKSENFNFAAVVVGVFSVQIVILFEHLLVRPMLSRR